MRPGRSRISVLLPHDSYLASERASEDDCNEVVDGSGRLLHLDSVRSVSGARRDEPHHVWDALVIDEQYRRFLNDLEVDVAFPKREVPDEDTRSSDAPRS